MACATTKDTEKHVVSRVSADDSESILALEARMEDLNNKVYLLTEQLQTLRSRIRNDKTLSPQFKAVQKTKPQKTTRTADFELVTETMKRKYSSAYKYFKQGEYAKGLIAFSSFIENYPDSLLTDNAYFWLGECYYQQGEYALAIDEYLKVIKKFPDASKVPEAMLKIAMSYKMLGEEYDSNSYLKELITRYPNSRASFLARTKTMEGSR